MPERYDILYISVLLGVFIPKRNYITFWRIIMKIKSGFVLEKVGGEYLAIAVGELADSFNGMVRLNETGAFLWKLLDESEYTRDELAKKLAEACVDVTPADVLPGVVAFEENLRAAGILEN